MGKDKKKVEGTPVVRERALKDFSLKGYVTDSLLFSDQSKNLPGGGRFLLNVQNEKVAAKILQHYKANIAFFQVAKGYAVKRNKGQSAHVTGFSPKIEKSEISRSTPQLVKRLQRAIRDSAVNAANQIGHHYQYDREKAPAITRPKTKASFYLVIWFTGDNRQTFFPAQ